LSDDFLNSPKNGTKLVSFQIHRRETNSLYTMDALGHNSVVEHQGLVILGSTKGEIWMKRLNIEQR